MSSSWSKCCSSITSSATWTASPSKSWSRWEIYLSDGRRYAMRLLIVSCCRWQMISMRCHCSTWTSMDRRISWRSIRSPHLCYYCMCIVTHGCLIRCLSWWIVPSTSTTCSRSSSTISSSWCPYPPEGSSEARAGSKSLPDSYRLDQDVCLCFFMYFHVRIPGEHNLGDSSPEGKWPDASQHLFHIRHGEGYTGSGPSADHSGRTVYVCGLLLLWTFSILSSSYYLCVHNRN